MRSRKLTAGVVFAVCSVVALMLAAWATGGSSRSAAGPIGSGKASAKKSVCGMGTGKKATGKPIKLGAINMLIPGVDFTTLAKLAEAYFKCVNDNGGIHNRPIRLIQYTEQLNPAQQASLARKLVTSDKVVGIVANTSFTECGTNWKYFQSKGYTVIGGGVQAECFGTPPYAESNMGPRYSNIGAAQALVRAGAKSIVVSSPATVAEYANGGPLLVAKQAGIPGINDAQQLPITDANSIVVKLVQEAKQAAGGGKGGVILDYTPESALPLLKAAEAQGLIDDVFWGSSTPIANEFVASQVSSEWNKSNLCCINSEFGLLTDTGPDMTLYRQITKKYAPSVPIQSFGQMGFLVGKFTTAALLSVNGRVTKESYNAAVQNLANQPSDILCKPWYFGKGLKAHIPNNWDITVSYSGGKVVQVEKCFAIAAVDKDLVATRAAEKKFKLNTAK
jgi:branched-chain amino acid transport system substrate-binding protein